MKPPGELSLREARDEVETLRSKLSGNDYLAPGRVYELTLVVRSVTTKLRLARSGLALGLLMLAAGLAMVVTTHPVWVLLAIAGLLTAGGSGVAAYGFGQRLAKETQLLERWREALVRREAKVIDDSLEQLTIYRIRAVDVVDELRLQAHSNRRIHNLLQITIIVGSILVTSLTSIGASTPVLRWAAVAVAASVSIGAGVSSYFKYRERSQNQQRTADAIEKELHLLKLGVGHYAGKRIDALKRFAVTVEALREEQRKAELQLDQTSAPDVGRAGPPQQS